MIFSFNKRKPGSIVPAILSDWWPKEISLFDTGMMYKLCADNLPNLFFLKDDAIMFQQFPLETFQIGLG